MKPKIIIFIILGIILGLSIYGYFNAISESSSQGENRPEIEITPKTFEFGEIEYGKVAKHVFKIKNLGNETLEIKRVSTSCGCTTAKVSKEKINAGEEVDLNVEYNTGAMSGSHAKGKQERIIYVKSNDSINPQVEVTISAYVK